MASARTAPFLETDVTPARLVAVPDARPEPGAPPAPGREASDEADERIEHLERALASGRRIGMAIGILMERHRLTEAGAFDLLREASQHRNVKLRLIADELVYTGIEPG